MSDSLLYSRSPANDTPLLQGEILSGLVQVRLDLKTLGSLDAGLLSVLHPYAVVMSQSCDLETDRLHRAKPDEPTLPDILFCQLPPAQAVWEQIRATEARKRIALNKDERYHFLESIGPEFDAQKEGIEECCIDFKRYFTVPSDEVYARIQAGMVFRRTILLSPYLEHLSSRFGYFLSRVALPQQHSSD